MQTYKTTLIKKHFSLKVEDNLLNTISDSPIYLVLTVVATVTFLMEVLYFFA